MVEKVGQPMSWVKLESTNKAKEPATEVRTEVASPTVNKQGGQVSNRASEVIRQLSQRYAADSQTLKKGLSLQERALRRAKINQARMQHNLETILQQADEYVDDTECNERLDEDWLHQFFSLAENIFSKPMQVLWGKILAMQTLRPGSFSLRALNTLKQMTHKDALIFQRACTLLLRDQSHSGGRIITGCYRVPSWYQLLTVQSGKKLNLSQFQFNYPDLLSLIDLNLVYSSEIESPLKPEKPLKLYTSSSSCTISARNNQMVLTYYRLTQAGSELANLLPGQLNDDFKKQLPEQFLPWLDVVFNDRD